MFDVVFAKNKNILIPFLMAGVPHLDQSYNLACAMIEGGAKILELGVPFSDPSADGVVLQEAASIALANRVTLYDVLMLSKKINQTHPEIPIVLFTYLNPLRAMGLKNYVKLALDSGIAATLTVDLPLEEAQDYLKLHREYGLKTVFLASPTTTKERLQKIDQASTAFLYYVSRNGVTGEASKISSTLDQEVSEVKKLTKSPLAIGFGISNADQAREVSKLAGAVIIGSAYMRIILETSDPVLATKRVREFTEQCVLGITSEF